MRRVFVSLLAVLYLAMTGGVTLCAHYCMGEQQSTELALFSTEEHACGKCGMTNAGKGDDACCKDEHKVVKLEQQHVPGIEISVPCFDGLVALLAPLQTWQASRSLIVYNDLHDAKGNGPPGPRIQSTPIYVRVQSFRI